MTTPPALPHGAAPSPTGAFVLGAPRSGTSAVTRIVSMAGLSLSGDLVGGGRNNPSGHFESAAVVGIDRRLLAAAGTRWWCPPAGPLPPATPGWPDAAGAARAGFSAAHPARGWVSKDPRLAFTLPLWRAAVDPAPACVLVVRSPAAVVASMQRTWALTTAHALALWERYLRSSLAAVAGLPVFVAPYELTVSAPARWAGELAGFLESLGLPGSTPDPDQLASFVRAPRGPRGPTDEAIGATRHHQDLAEALERLVGAHPAFEPTPLPPEPEASRELFTRLQAGLAAGHGLDVRPRWRAARQRTSQNPGPDAPPEPSRRIVVFAMGKTGTTSVQRAIERAAAPGWDVHRVHHLSPAAVRSAEGRYSSLPEEPPHLRSAKALQATPPSAATPWDVVTLVREPIARNVAHFFQVGEREGWFGPGDLSDPAAPVLLRRLVGSFVEHFAGVSPAGWFDEELRCVLGVDVLGAPYDTRNGQLMVAGGHLRVLVLRSEDLASIGERSLSLFLGREVRLGRDNDGTAKAYAPLYRTFLERARLPEAAVEALLRGEVVDHFYQPEEIECIRARWAGSSAAPPEAWKPTGGPDRRISWGSARRDAARHGGTT